MNSLITKQCKDCLKELPLSEFAKNSSAKDGYQSRCFLCTRKRSNDWYAKNIDYKSIKSRKRYQEVKDDEDFLRQKKSYRDDNFLKRKEQEYQRHYGLSLENVEKLIKEQNYLCKICKKEKVLVVDHCHESLIIRGMICHSCNKALGYFKDSIDSLKSAIDYLESSKISEDKIFIKKRV